MPERELKEAVLSETREELAKADAKASILLAASGIVFAALLAGGSNSSWYPDTLECDTARWFAWTAVALTLAGIVVVGAAVKPRLRAKRAEPAEIHYFGDVEAYWPRWWQLRSREEHMKSGRRKFAAALRATSDSKEQLERLDDQIWTLSHIAYRKYRLVSIGMLLYVAAVAAALVALVLERQWL